MKNVIFDYSLDQDKSFSVIILTPGSHQLSVVMVIARNF